MIGREYAVLAGAILSAAVLVIGKLSGRKPKNIILFSTAFVYFTALITVTFFPVICDNGNPAAKTSALLQTVPFHTINNMIKYASDKTMVMQVVGNVLLTIPFGILLPVMIKKKDPLIILPLLLALPLVIESMQWIIGWLLGTYYRTTDIDDVILNFTGGLIGYTLFLTAALIRKKTNKNKNIPRLL